MALRTLRMVQHLKGRDFLAGIPVSAMRHAFSMENIQFPGCRDGLCRQKRIETVLTFHVVETVHRSRLDPMPG